jgi:hypothetical protein
MSARFNVDEGRDFNGGEDKEGKEEFASTFYMLTTILKHTYKYKQAKILC